MSPPPAAQRQRRSRSRGAARSVSTDYESDTGPSRRSGRRRGGRQQGMPGIAEDQQGGQVGQYSPQQMQQQQQQQMQQQQQQQQPPAQQEDGGGDEALKLKLEINLDVWVELKAKVHGDVTLSLLG